MKAQAFPHLYEHIIKICIHPENANQNLILFASDKIHNGFYRFLALRITELELEMGLD